MSYSKEPDWLVVLRIFYEENLSFEYTPCRRNWVDFFPDEKVPDEIDLVSELKDLEKSGYVVVEETSIPDRQSTEIDSIPFVRISQKGLEAVYDWDRQQAQREFERKQVTRQNKSNIAIGYLTLGLLTINAINIIQQVASDGYIAGRLEWVIIGITVLVTTILFKEIFKQGLLNTE